MVRKIHVKGSWADTVTAAVTRAVPNVRGVIKQMEVKVNDNTGNRTATVAIATDDSAAALFSKAAIPENATTVYTFESHLATQDADFNPVWIHGDVTFTLTPSGDPGATGMTVDVYVLLGDSD